MIITHLFSQFFIFIAHLIMAFLFTICSLFFRFRKKEKIIFGTTPIISYSYWSRALRQKGYPTSTFMKAYYNINSKEDFDLFFVEITPKFLRRYKFAINACGLIFLLRNARIFVTTYDPVFFKNFLGRFEIILFKIAKSKVVIIPYGSDAYMYSLVKDLSVRHALLLSYPNNSYAEWNIFKKILFSNKYADIVACGFQNDGIGRWDLLVHQICQIDTKSWSKKEYYSNANGINGPVRIVHTPNHRGFKGSEFVEEAIKDLKTEGLKIEYIELSGVSNLKVKEVIHQSDILVDQLICTAYALSGIEGMAVGLPVVSNLDCSLSTDIFRRYSFLNECPIVSSTPETIKSNLRALITHPNLRKELGLCSRKYVEKYHSYKTTQYIFGSIFDKILHLKDVDLMNLFHPITSSYNKKTPIIQHPLKNNQLPEKYF